LGLNIYIGSKLAQLAHNGLKVGSYRRYLQASRMLSGPKSRKPIPRPSFGKELANQKLENFKIFLHRAVARKFLQHDKFVKIYMPTQFSGTETNR